MGKIGGGGVVCNNSNIPVTKIIQDRTALNEINELGKDLDVLYVVSKIDPEERLSSDEEDGEVERVQDSKKKRVLEKLIKHGFLSADDLRSKERFHGLSAWKIHKWNQLKKENPEWDDPDYMEYIRDFEHFKRCLQSFYEARLRAEIEKAAMKLIGVLSRCLDFFIKKANVLLKDNEAIRVMLKTAQEEEETLHEGIIRDLENRHKEIAEVIQETVEEAKEEILKEAGVFEYDNEKITGLTTDGYVSSGTAKKQCQLQICNMATNKLQAKIIEKLQHMFASRDQFLKELEERIKKLEEETRKSDDSPSTAAHAIAQSLVTCYDVQVKPTITFSGLLRSFCREFIRIWRNILRRDLSEILFSLKGRLRVGDAEWKKEIARKGLAAVNPDEIAKDLIKGLKKHFVGCHKTFASEIGKITDLFQVGETLKDDQRKKIRELAPDIARLEMWTHSVLDRQRFGVPEKGELIGSGGQGKVYACKNIRSPAGKPCAVKVLRLSDNDQLKDLTLELHNTRYDCSLNDTEIHQYSPPLFASIVYAHAKPNPLLVYQ